MLKNRFLTIGGNSIIHFSLIAAIAFAAAACGAFKHDSAISFVSEDGYIWFKNSDIRLRFDEYMNYKVFPGNESGSINFVSDSTSSDFVVAEGKTMRNFKISEHSVEVIHNEFGEGKKLVLTGSSEEKGETQIEKRLTVELYESYPDAAVFYADYKNTGSRKITLDRIHSNQLVLDASLTNTQNQPFEFWSYQGSSVEWGIDYVFKLDKEFSRKNWMGVQPETKTGGGIPLVDFWTGESGLAIAHIEPKPKNVSFPVQVQSDQRVQIGIENALFKTLPPQASHRTLKTAVFAHSLDYFNPLQTFARLMGEQGLRKKPSSDGSYDPVWCGWGYLTDFTPEDIYGTLPKLKELGFQWVVIDDRWWDRYGDWNPRKETFPGGEKQMKQFVDSLHQRGFKTKIWWVPTSVQPADPPEEGFRVSVTPGMTEIEKNHKEWLIMDENGEYPTDNRDMYQFCPAVPEVQDYIKNLTVQFIEEWGYDGHKLDAYYVVPPCHNPAHNHDSPDESYEELPNLIRIIYETTKSIKPGGVTEICNCGTTQDFYQSLYTDQPVTSDPVTFEQARKRTKAFKALWGADSPIYNDHIEIIPEYLEIMDENYTEVYYDFASLIGTGGVPGTKFTWPEGPEQMRLTPEKEKLWDKWFSIYRDKMLSKGEYLNLYDIAHDQPETHTIKKDDTLYYSFFADSWEGDIELRGLENRSYELYDYENEKLLGTVTGPAASISADFERHLLIECRPADRQ